MNFAPGVELGGYRLVSRIGAGGMGEVWRAEDKRLGRSVAIKILPPGVAVDDESRARFEREARTAAQMSHPNITTIHSFDEVDGRAYIVMEYIEGESLGAAIRRKALSESEVCRVGRGVAEALREAHDRGIVHRDIKPENILLSGERVKVLDFGIAKYAAHSAAASQEVTAPLTQAGMILGTVQYMSPEQALGRPLDGRSDIFSLGVVMYEALSGRLPFGGGTITEILTQIIRDRPLDVAKAVPGVSASLAQVIRKCLAKEPGGRYANAGELIDAIDAALPLLGTSPGVRVATLRIPSTVPATSASPQRSRARWIVPLVAAMVIVAAGIAVGLVRREQGATPGPQTARLAVQQSVQPTPATTLEVAAPSVPATESVTKIEKENAQPATAAPDPTEKAEVPTPTTSSASESAEARARRHHEDGMRILSAGHPRAAGVEFAAALHADPHHAPSRLRIAEGLLAKGITGEAREQFHRTLQDRDRLDEREVMLAKIGAAFTSGETEKARTLADSFKARYPGDRELAAVYQVVTERGLGAKPGRRQPPQRRPRRF